MAYASDSFANSSHRPKRASSPDRVVCATPTPGKSSTSIPRWKYETVREAIRHAIVSAGSRGATLEEIVEHAEERLTIQQRADLGSVTWHVMTVKLDLEAKGEIGRISGASPIRHVRCLRDAA
jgi:hypothetical protein